MPGDNLTGVLTELEELRRKVSEYEKLLQEAAEGANVPFSYATDPVLRRLMVNHQLLNEASAGLSKILQAVKTWSDTPPPDNQVGLLGFRAGYEAAQADVRRALEEQEKQPPWNREVFKKSKTS